MSKQKSKPSNVAQQHKWPKARGTKLEKLITLLRSKEGATIAHLARALRWQPHTVHGVISGTLRKRLGLKVLSVSGKGPTKTYRIAQAG